MPVAKYRSIEQMPPPWREPDDPGNLRAVAAMMALYRSMRPREPHRPGVRKFRTLVEMNEDRRDPYRREDPRLGPAPSWSRGG